MFHRFPTWWRALSVVLLCLATVTWPSAAQARTTSSFKVAHQGAWVTLSHAGRARLGVTLELHAPHENALAQLSLFPRIETRAQIIPLINGIGTHAPAVSTSATFSLDCAARRSISLTVALFTRAPRSRG